MRLNLARLDDKRDTVTLSAESFVPRGDAGRMLGYLGANGGDHLQAAVENLLGRTPTHLEQAIAADGLSAASLEVLRPKLREQWRRLGDELVPLLEKLIEADADAPASQPRHRVRVGLYGFDTPSTAVQASPSMPVRKRPKGSKP